MVFERSGLESWGKPLLRWGGLALLTASLAYLAVALAKLDLTKLIAVLDWRDWLSAGILSGCYAMVLALLAKGWSAMAAPGRRVDFITVTAVYGPGVVAKYLPGSVFQYASRHLIGAREKMQHEAMAKASIVEAVLHVGLALVLAGCLLAGVGFWTVVGMAAFGLILAVRPSEPIIASLAWQLLFFSFFALITIFVGTLGPAADNPSLLAGYFFLAWTVGFLVPIAPGGIGVREAVLLALTTHAESVETVILFALLARLIGIAGDGLFGLIGYFALVRRSREKRPA